ncbi:MAG: BREX-3 system phosphatase PglZ [bacterium]|nr:BREX-3 system phosphatase PglZ [bacterium]
MTDWRDGILREFIPGVSPLTLALDPDRLLLEETILQQLLDLGFHLEVFDDPVAFRYIYESKFRSQWDKGENIELVVVFISDSPDSIPYDLLQSGRQVSFSLGDIFPELSYPVIAALDRGDLDALYNARKAYNPGKCGDKASREFILRHVFGITPELIKEPADLLHNLLHRHYSARQLPESLDRHFIRHLSQNPLFQGWPLESIVGRREAFFAFLQERWPLFLAGLDPRPESSPGAEEPAGPLTYPGPAMLPFQADNIRVYIDNLFLEGLLHPVTHEQALPPTASWAGMGIRKNPAGERVHKLEQLSAKLLEKIPGADARHLDWLHFAYPLAEAAVLEHQSREPLPSHLCLKLHILHSRVDRAFSAWICHSLPFLINQPPVPPVMVHHIPRMLADEIAETRSGKVAFLLVDGLALAQWLVLRDVLQAQRPELIFREDAVFAWIPTLTSVSRQAAFSGKPPSFFPESIGSTAKDKKHWCAFWESRGFRDYAVTYKVGLTGTDGDKIDELVSPHGLRVAGLVINTVDKIMHGMQLGAAGMHNQVRQWASGGHMAQLIDTLLDRDYQVFLSSDHGNIEAVGVGNPKEGVLADTKGQRVRIYRDIPLRNSVARKFPDALQWPANGLPDNYHPLLAPKRNAFYLKEKSIVTHGGASIEEVIVPMVRIQRKNHE